MKRQVLFLCATNGPNSLVSEALLRHIDSKNFEAFSASTTCREVHPLLTEVMNEIGIDLGHKTPKTVAELGNQRFDFVVTLDEISAEQHPSIIAGDTVRWRFENPLAVSDEPEKQRRAFRSVRDQIAQRLRLFSIVHSRPDSSPTQARAARAPAV